MELKIKKSAVGKYGPYLQDETGKFYSATKEVQTQVTGPCTIEATIAQVEGHPKITAVTIKANTTPNQDSKVEFRLNVDAGNCLERAVQLYIAGKGQTLLTCMGECIAAFRKGLVELNTKPEPTNEASEEDNY